ncbi:glycosyltransferase family 4 protein [Dysgonomonas massiliensis]|uniref:glycosyltransferase family 4 protein n=1 Tax=Dysgonomonas massiliensis TaxID=2040292 RepID=UPI000C783E5E|nr:glycosyltransferase family 4 protein [Dysgonomonas massiliensis]
MTINTKQVLVISESLEGKGGVISVVQTLAPFYSEFHHIASTCNGNFIIKIFYFARAIVLLNFYLAFKNIRIVHIHTAAKGSYFRKSILGLFVKLYKRRLIYHIHGSEFKDFCGKYNFFNWISKSLGSADIIIVLSKSWEKFFKEDLKITSEVVILNNIVNKAKQFEKQEAVFPLKLLFLGLIGKRKGVFDLLQVVSDNKELLREKVNIFIGGNGLTEELKSFIYKNGIDDIVFYEGWVQGEHKARLLEMSDIYILPSYNEGLPISILEAMSYGLPIISTNVGGIPEVVCNNINGLIIEAGDLKAILNSILFFVEDIKHIEEMGRNSLSIVKDYFPDHVIPILKDIYIKLDS